jgi:hypothetical protein
MADACKRSFWHFLLYAFGVKNFMDANPQNQWLTTRIHKPLADFLDKKGKEWMATRATRKTPMKIMVVWPRGCGKTTIVTKAFQLWLHVLDPDLSSTTDSVTTAKSWDFLRTLKEVMSGADGNAWFTRLYGNWYDKDRPWKNGYLIHAKRNTMAKSEASMETTSVERGITGKHPDVLFIDDPVVQEKLVEGGNWHQKTHEHCDAVIPALQPWGMLVASATRYGDDDWLARYIETERVKEIWGMEPKDVEEHPDGQWILYFLQARDQFGVPVLPEIHSPQWLDEYEKKNPMDFAAQMMNEPGTGEHMPLTREQIEFMWVNMKDVPGNLRISVHCDTAWKDREKIGRGDYNVIQVWGHSRDGSGEVYFLEGHRSNLWRAEEFGDRLVGILQRLRREKRYPFVITDEQSLGGKQGGFELLVETWCAGAGLYAPPLVLINRQGKKKEMRIREAAGYWADGKVRLVRHAPEIEHLVKEMLKVGVSRFDDMADAAADVFNPEVYVPERVLGRDHQAMVPRRPGDEYLQIPMQLWGDEDVREAYDNQVDKELTQLDILERSGW